MQNLEQKYNCPKCGSPYVTLVNCIHPFLSCRDCDYLEFVEQAPVIKMHRLPRKQKKKIKIISQQFLYETEIDNNAACETKFKLFKK